jgi:2-polyprenyl-3-methyl-5-hydroxy-6-metoxy-1,4-benzoquinol methylase
MGKKQYSEIVGIEPNEVQATQARNSVRVQVYNEPYSDECFAENRFDVITFIQVMEHLPDPLAAMRAAYRHLKPGGMLVIEVPSFNNPRVLLSRLTRISWFVRSDFIPTHISYFTAKTLSTCVRKSGFVVKKIQIGNYAAKMGLGHKIGWFVDFILATNVRRDSL